MKNNYGSDTEDLKPIPVPVGKDVFLAAPALPGAVLADVMGINAITDQAKRIRAIYAFFDDILEPASATRFRERLHSTTEPITLEQAVDIFNDLLAEYTGSEDEDETTEKAGTEDTSTRPTKAAASSPDGSATTGQSSLAAVLYEGSTPDENLSASS